MTIFFLVVGLEIKREIVEGELRDPRRRALPVVAALGGMVGTGTPVLGFQLSRAMGSRLGYPDGHRYRPGGGGHVIGREQGCSLRSRYFCWRWQLSMTSAPSS